MTNLDGEIAQYIEYIPFGEVFLEEKNNVWNTPYNFNGKELEEETWIELFWSRYYNPRESVWLSVDPLAEKTMTPYAYCNNNPINLVDPDGMEADWIGNGTYTAKKGDTMSGLDKKLGLKQGAIKGINPNINPTELQIGQTVNGARSVLDLLIVPYSADIEETNLIGCYPEYTYDRQMTDEQRLYFEMGRGVFNLVLSYPGLNSVPKNKSFNPSPVVTKGTMEGRRLLHTFSKHGAQNTAELQRIAKGSRSPQGQWLHNAKGQYFIRKNLDQLHQGSKTIRIPQGLGRTINPDGSFTPTTHARLVRSKSGVKTAFPGTLETLPK